MRTKLLQARTKKHWTQKQAAAFAAVDYATYRRWESGETTPRASSIRGLCDAFEMSAEALGFDDDGPIALSPLRGNYVADDLTMKLWSVAFMPQNFQAIQTRVAMIIEEYDAMNGETMNRREALARLASLPLIVSLGTSVKQPQAEDIITQCSASVAACWELSKSSYEEDLHRAFYNASAFIEPLKTIVSTSSRFRQEAAALVGQCALLKTMLGWHLEGLREAAIYAQESIVYAQEAGDIALQVTAMDYLCWALYYDNRSQLALQTAARARTLIKQYEAELPPMLCSGVYSTYAVLQAKNGGQSAAIFDQAGRYFIAGQSSPLKYVYMDYAQSALVLNEGMIHYFAGDQQKAMKSFQDIINIKDLSTKLQVPGRTKIETLNFMALASLKQKDKDMDQALFLWKAAMQGAKSLQSEQRYTECRMTYDIMDAVWSGESKIKTLRELAIHW